MKFLHAVTSVHREVLLGISEYLGARRARKTSGKAVLTKKRCAVAFHREKTVHLTLRYFGSVAQLTQHFIPPFIKGRLQFKTYTLHHRDDHRRYDRLGQIIEHAGLYRVTHILKILIAADHHKTDLGVCLSGSFCQLQAAHEGHGNIGQYKVGLCHRKHVKRFASVPCRSDYGKSRTVSFDDALYGLHRHRLIIHDHHTIFEKGLFFCHDCYHSGL